MNSVDMRCVRAGICLLDRIKPEWRQLVDRDTLDMRDPLRCIAGQVFANEGGSGSHLDGYSYLLTEVMKPGWDDCDHGFYIHPEGSDYAGLKNAWIELARL